MAARKVQLKDNSGNKAYPVTSSACVGMSDGSGSLDSHINKITTEYNVSLFHPTEGIDGGNKYTLETAIAKVPAELRNVGIKCSFLDEAGELETWEWKGKVFSNPKQWVRLVSQDYSDKSVSEPLIYESIAEKSGRVIDVEGEEIVYGTGHYTDFIELDSVIVLKNVRTIAGRQAVVAFYDNDKVFISEYKDYIGNFSEGYAEFKSIVIYPSIYPKARFCRISFAYRSDGVPTELKKVSVKKRIESLESNLAQMQECIKVKTDLVTSTAYMKSTYITVSGTLSNWGEGRIYRIELPLSYKTIVIDKLKAVRNVCLLAAYYKGENEFISAIFQAKSGEVKDNLIINADDAPSEAEYILLASERTSIPVVYSIDLDASINDVKELISQQNIKSDNIIKVLEDKFVPETSNGYIDYLGNLSSWNGTSVTDYIEIEQKHISINTIRTVAGRIHIVAFYNANKEYIADYKDFYYESGDGERDIENISFFSQSYPLASYIRISGKFQDNTEIRIVDISGINERLSSLEEAFSNSDFSEGNPIYGIGDSIGSQIFSALVNNIKSIDEREIINGCIGGESVLDSLAKNNVIPYTALPFTIPSSTTQSKAVTILSSRFLQTDIDEDGETLTYLNTYKVGEDGEGDNPSGEGINPWNSLKCTIGGIKGTLYFKRSSPSRENNYFIRDEEGEEVVFDRPQLVIPTDLESKNDIWVAFMGTNGGWSPLTQKADFNACADILVNYYEQLRDYFNHDNYLFLGFYMAAYIDQASAEDRIAHWKYFEDKMVEKFGKHYFSVRQYLREYGWRDAGYQLGYRLVTDSGDEHYTCLTEDIESDKKAIADGQIPWCIVNGKSGVHMLSRASACVANQVIKRLYELGCITECPQIDISTIQDAENADINEPDYGG